jgi:hypothetical protein
MCFDETELSTARIDVVPTVQMRFSLLLHRLQYHKLLGDFFNFRIHFMLR